MNIPQAHGTSKPTQVRGHIKLKASVINLFYSDRRGYPDDPPSKEEAVQELADNIQARLDTFYRKNPHMKRTTVNMGKIRLNSPKYSRFLDNCLRITKCGEAKMTTDDNSSKDDIYEHQFPDHKQASLRLERKKKRCYC
ncbi:hypothetical protein BDV38DRAFT_290902 [Aspergillus pseudotamarii]|uniref:Uncharacterized protein n=1 Tax=Aspergillus pseudotamarii TaxID=132259 RepID=A0A5N6S8J5_ASPPS|nr:uncharacterized protein BDV38DRAFT_290902 [Aspergillus pseudotamarii]KAE8130988.1 hypothetical protein BDV38DRAFT_290902 [Aspergillus pseudotamarii]